MKSDFYFYFDLFIFVVLGFELFFFNIARQMKIQKCTGLLEINVAFQIDHALGPPSPGPGTHAPPHSLIIGWESPGSSLPIG
jgi:hypothetical protein